MSDEVAAPAPADAFADATVETNDSKTSNGTTANGDEKPSTDAAPADEPKAESKDLPEAGTDAAAPNAEDDDAKVSEAAATAETSKKDKRKSTSAVPEHKGKKLSKKKSMPVLQLDCKPGDYYWARMKGHQAWPAIIAEEEMLPEKLLATRPVSAARPDGSLRDDFKPDGKNAKERTYAVMYLATNEFSWINNASLTPLDPEQCKVPPKSKVKHIEEAYALAIEQHGLEYFKDLLAQAHEERMAIEEEIRQQEEEAARKLEERAAKAEDKKKKPRKSKGAADEDSEMADGDAPKSTKKRKKAEESDSEGLKPKKTPKVTKLNGPKTPAAAETPTAKKSSSKPKKKVAAPKADEDEVDTKISEEERVAQLEKSILYFRHRLQRGFLSRDEPPKESEMATMAEYFAQLEHHEDLSPHIIRTTKIHKVLKAIVKLSSIPKEEEYNFKKRSSALLEVWNKRMEADSEANAKATPVPAKEQPETNGASKSENEAESGHVAEDSKAEAAAPSEEATKDEKDEQGDVEMKTAPAENGEEPAAVESAEAPTANGHDAATDGNAKEEDA